MNDRKPKIIEWNSTRQFTDKLEVTNLTRLRYNLLDNESVVLTDSKDYSVELDGNGMELTIKNKELISISVYDKYKFGNIIHKNVMKSKLYLQVLNYSSFFTSFTDFTDIESTYNTDDINFYKDFDLFFSTLNTDLDMTDDDYSSLKYGFGLSRFQS